MFSLIKSNVLSANLEQSRPAGAWGNKGGTVFTLTPGEGREQSKGVGQSRREADQCREDEKALLSPVPLAIPDSSTVLALSHLTIQTEHTGDSANTK